MKQNANTEADKQKAMAKIEDINAVEGFDPAPLAIEIANMNEGGVRYRLPVMAQMAWFRLKYPEGRLAVSVKPGKDPTGNVYFIAEARVYAHYNNPAECYLAEGSASRGYITDKPTVSPREWAQTAAIGMALRNAGFGLQFAVAGESYDDNALNELSGIGVRETPGNETPVASPEGTRNSSADPAVKADAYPSVSEPPVQKQPDSPTPQPALELSPLEKAMAVLCPIGKHKEKTLGEMLRIDPGVLAYIAKHAEKYSSEAVEAARLICENAVQLASA